MTEAARDEEREDLERKLRAKKEGADQGLVVTRESIWNANPKSVVALLPPDALNARIASTRTHVLVELGPDRVWLRRNEHNILLAATMSGEVDVLGQIGYLDVWNHDRFLAKLQREPYTDDDARALSEFGI